MNSSIGKIYRSKLTEQIMSFFCKADIPVRNFFNATRNHKIQEFESRKLVGFSMEQIYNVVSDVGNYKHFLPFCKKSDVMFQKDNFLKANLVIGFPPLTENYTSNVTMINPHLVKAECKDGTIFNHLVTLWVFSPGLKNNPQSCVIDFSLSFEFRSALHHHLANFVFYEITRQMENAFYDEAKKRHGKPSMKAVPLER